MKKIFFLLFLSTSFLSASRNITLDNFDNSYTKKFEENNISTFSLFKFIDPYNSVETEHFKIYWGNTSPGTILWNDQDNNSFPDYIDTLKESLEYSLDKYLELNFVWPKSDKVEILVANTNLYENNNEIVLDDGYIGISTEGRIIFNGNINGSSYPAFTSPNDLLKVTIAHEIFHIFQLNMRTDYTSTNIWLYEGTAVWGEKYIYPEIYDYIYSYGEDLPGSMAKGLAENSGFYSYATNFFFNYLTNKYDNSIIKELFDSFKTYSNYNALYSTNLVLNKKGSSLVNEVYNFYKYIESETEDFYVNKLKSYLESEYIQLFGFTSFYNCFNYDKYIYKTNFSYTKLNDSCKNYSIFSNDLLNIGTNTNIFKGKGLNSNNQKETFFVYSFEGFESITDNNSHEIKITANDSFDIEVNNTWNFISTTVDVDSSSFDKDSIEYIWAYEDNLWKLYIPNSDTIYKYEKLDKIKANQGIWVKSSFPNVINLDEISPSYGECSFENLKSGWNLWANACNEDLDFQDLDLDYKVIWGYEDEFWSLKENNNIIHNYNNLENLKKKKAYWIYIN